MKGTVDKIKVRRRPEKNGHGCRNKINRVFANANDRQPAARVNPKRNRLIRGPDSDTGYQAPEHVVPDLIAPQEYLVVGGEPLIEKLVCLVLSTPNIKPPVQTAGHQC